MKKILLLILTTGICFCAYSQKGLYIGVKGAGNITHLKSDAITREGSRMDYINSYGAQTGGSLLFMFHKNAGLALEFMYGSTNQRYTNRIPYENRVNVEEFESSDHINTLDIPFALRIAVKNFYVEAGMQLSIINSGIYTAEAHKEKYNLGFSGDEVFNYPNIEEEIPYLNSSYFATVLGVGYHLKLSERLMLNSGVRFTNGLGDVFSEAKLIDLIPWAQYGYEPTYSSAIGLHLGLQYNLMKNK